MLMAFSIEVFALPKGLIKKPINYSLKSSSYIRKDISDYFQCNLHDENRVKIQNLLKDASKLNCNEYTKAKPFCGCVNALINKETVNVKNVFDKILNDYRNFYINDQAQRNMEFAELYHQAKGGFSVTRGNLKAVKKACYSHQDDFEEFKRDMRAKSARFIAQMKQLRSKNRRNHFNLDAITNYTQDVADVVPLITNQSNECIEMIKEIQARSIRSSKKNRKARSKVLKKIRRRKDLPDVIENLTLGKDALKKKMGEDFDILYNSDRHNSLVKDDLFKDFIKIQLKKKSQQCISSQY